jgi:hypothetical protein
VCVCVSHVDSLWSCGVSTVCGVGAGSTNTAFQWSLFNGARGIVAFNRTSTNWSTGTQLYAAVADVNNNQIRLLNYTSGSVSTLAGTITAGFINNGTIGTGVRFKQPKGLTLALDGTTLLVADSGNNAIRAVVLATGACRHSHTHTHTPSQLHDDCTHLYVQAPRPRLLPYPLHRSVLPCFPRASTSQLQQTRFSASIRLLPLQQPHFFVVQQAGMGMVTARPRSLVPSVMLS